MAQSARRLHQCHEQVTRLYPIPRLHIYFGNDSGALGHKLHFHLHGLNGQEWITLSHVLARLHHHRHDKPRHGSPDMGRIILLGAGTGRRHSHTGLQHFHNLRLTVEFEEQRDVAGVIRFRAPLQTDDECLAALQVDRDLFAYT